MWYFSGDKYDLFWSHINASYGMAIITNPIEQNTDLTWVMTTVELAIREVEELIAGLDEETSPQPAKKETAKKAAQKEGESSSKVAKAELPKDTPKGSNGSAKKEGKKPSPEKNSSEVNENDVHEFWKAATLEEEIIRIDSPDSLSFEQAQKLGFIPNGDSTEA
jgi:hypothetical protein